MQFDPSNYNCKTMVEDDSHGSSAHGYLAFDSNLYSYTKVVIFQLIPNQTIEPLGIQMLHEIN